jgi:copper homeostasis protein
MITLEICANSLSSAMAAQAGGADRIELCENLSAGGTTPGFGTLTLARKMLTIPIHVLIRPRPGDFLYNEAEFASMKMDIHACKEMEINGVVIGMLNPDGTIDTRRCKELVELARPMSVTFHRAFDLCADPFQAMEEIIDLDFDRILTAGQESKVTAGALLLHQLVQKAGDRIIIMPGSGINTDNINLILEATMASEVHMTAGSWMPSHMEFRHPRTRLSEPPEDDFRKYETDVMKVRDMKDLLIAYSSKANE